jgi:hypothetical protein
MQTKAPSLLRVAYGGALILLLLPLLELAITAWPFQPSVDRWRVATFGIFANMLPMQLLAVLLAALTAQMLAHRRTLRMIGIFAGLAAALIAFAAGLFALDSLQFRNMLTAGATTGYDLTIAKTMFGTGLTWLVLAWLSAASWSASRPEKSKERSPREATLVRSRHGTEVEPQASDGIVAAREIASA